MHQKDIDSFLYLGYFLDYYNSLNLLDISTINKDRYNKMSINDLLKLASNLFMESINKLYIQNKKHVVPISGGLDSRAILAALLEFTEASNIYTYTFGTPNTFDYEIGNKLAHIVGTKHLNLPLTEYKYNQEELLDISKRIDHQTVLFHHPPIWKLDKLFSSFTVWSGFFGDALTGANYVIKDSIEVNKVMELFLNRNKYQDEILLTLNEINLMKYLVKDIKLIKNKINLYEYLMLDRELKFAGPHVLIKGFNFKTPFLDREFVNFFLSINERYRKNQLLYKKMLIYKFEKLFSYPVKNNHGLSLKAPRIFIYTKRIYNKIKRIINNSNPYINYLDFDEKIREKKDLQEIIRENIYDLYDRHIIDWLDVRKIFEDHINKKTNYGKALVLLSSLEIHMKAKKEV